MQTVRSAWTKIPWFLKERQTRALLSDFIYSTLYPVAVLDTKKADYFWHAMNGSLLPYVLGNDDSEWRVRQLASAFTKFYRYTTVSQSAEADAFISWLLRSCLSFECFSERSVRKRNMKRKFLMFKRNGGVYAEAGAIFQTQEGKSKVFKELERSCRVPERYFSNGDKLFKKTVHETNWDYEFDEFRDLFEREIARPFESVFKAVSERPINVYHDFATYDATLMNGEDVTISVMPPLRARMRRYELIPYKTAKAVLQWLPFTGASCAYLDYAVRRLEYDLGTEAKVRAEILSAFGIDCARESNVIQAAKKLDLPIDIAPPIVDLCSEHIMVTGRKPMYSMRTVKKSAASVIEAGARLMFDAKAIVPDLSRWNVKSDEHRVSLERFASAVRVTDDDLAGISCLVAGTATDDDELRLKAGNLLGLDGYKLDLDVLLREKNRKLISAKAPLVYAGGEFLANVNNYVREAKAPASVLSCFSTRFAKLAGVAAEPIQKYLERRADHVTY